MTVTLNFILSLNFLIVNKYYFYSILNFFPQNNFLKIKFTKHNIIYIQFNSIKKQREKNGRKPVNGVSGHTRPPSISVRQRYLGLLPSFSFRCIPIYMYLHYPVQCLLL